MLRCINNAYDLANNTIFYKEWMKCCVFSEDIINIAPELNSQNGYADADIDLIQTQEMCTVIELHFYIKQKLKLTMIRKSKIIGKPKIEFEILVTSCINSTKPKGIDLKILIKGTKISSSRTNLQMYCEVNHTHSFFSKDVSEQLCSVMTDSLQGFPLLINEKILQNNLMTLDALQRNSIKMKHQFENYCEEEKEIIEVCKEVNQENKISQIPIQSLTISTKVEEFSKESEETAEVNWREKCCKDGVWLKWTVERLAEMQSNNNQEQVEKYNDLKSRIHEKHGLPHVSESVMLRFIYGLEFDVDLAETKIVQHIKFMEENNYWNIDESRIPNIIKHHVLIVYKQDIYERPINYMRMGRFFPNDYEFEEIRTYCFWNLMNVNKEFKPYVESNIAIYDLKGLSKKKYKSIAF